MAYKSFKGKWQVGGDKPVISILSTGLICFNKACYETFVKPAGYTHMKLYYDAETKTMVFEPLHRKIGEVIYPIRVTKTGLLAVVKAKPFLEHFGIKYQGQSRSYPAYETIVPGSYPGYQRTRMKPNGIEIRLEEYIRDNS